jgi:hypothetical protein
MKHYSRQKHRLRHFRNSHFNDRQCNQCNEAVEHEMNLRRHMQNNHGLKTYENSVLARTIISQNHCYYLNEAWSKAKYESFGSPAHE